MVSPSNSGAYLFLIVTLLFGLPLLTAYYNVDSAFYFWAIIPYVFISILVAFLLILSAQRKSTLEGTLSISGGNTRSSFITRFNSIIPSYVIVALIALTIAL